jgi:hypothetical protein
MIEFVPGQFATVGLGKFAVFAQRGTVEIKMLLRRPVAQQAGQAERTSEYYPSPSHSASASNRL